MSDKKSKTSVHDADKQEILKALRPYSRAEVATHNTEEDCWMVYKNKVYDVTHYVHEHPAGPNYILDYAGEDTSTAFDDVGHSEEALQEMLKYHIGELTKDDIIDHEDGVTASDTGSKKWVKASTLTQKKQVSRNTHIFTFQFKESFSLDLVAG